MLFYALAKLNCFVSELIVTQRIILLVKLVYLFDKGQNDFDVFFGLTSTEEFREKTRHILVITLFKSKAGTAFDSGLSELLFVKKGAINDKKPI
jgi:hypothetical protein